MSQRKKFQDLLRQLDEIKSILNAMKNLSFLETRKLEERLINQKTMVTDLEEMANDFLGFYPQYNLNDKVNNDIWILFGSERSLCGDFNDSLLAQLPVFLDQSSNEKSLVPVGQKLYQLLQDDKRIIQYFNGADVAEEIPAVLADIVKYLESHQGGWISFNIYALFHQADTNQITSTRLIPPFRDRTVINPASYSHPPLLYLRPEEFFTSMVDYYLLIALHEIAYMSLMAENQQRIQHTEGAIQHLEEKIDDLTGKYHILRQEEITEEIEIILLNAC